MGSERKRIKMKKFYSIAVILCSLTFLVNGSDGIKQKADTGKQKEKAFINLKNADFEIVKNDKPKYWNTWGVDLKCIKSDFPRGNVSIEFKTKTGSKEGGISTKILQPLKAGNTYAFSFYAKGEIVGQKLKVALKSPGSGTMKACNRWKRFFLSKEWKKYTYKHTFAAEKGWKKRNFNIAFQGALNCYEKTWLDNLSAVVQVKDKKDTKSKLPDELITFKTGSKRNMLINPGFEFEWQGWMMQNLRDVTRNYTDTVDDKVYFSTDNPAHGKRCMVVPPNNTVCTIKYPFDWNTEYILSFYARKGKTVSGNKPGLSVAVKTPQWRGATLRLNKKLTSDWQRFQLKVSGPKLAKMKGGLPYPKHIIESVYLWIVTCDTGCVFDSFQLEKAPMTEYDPGCQVGFFPEAKDGIYLKDSKKGVQVEVRSPKGFKENYTLTIAGADVYGKTLWQHKFDISKSDKKVWSKSFSINNSRLGVVNTVAILTSQTNPENPVCTATLRYVVIDSMEPMKRNPYAGCSSYEDIIAPFWLVAERLKIENNILGICQSKIQPLFPKNVPSDFVLDAQARKNRVSMINRKVALFKKYNWKLCYSQSPAPGSPLYPRTYRPLSKAERMAEYAKIADDLISLYEAFNGNFHHVHAIGEPNNFRVRKGPDKGKMIFPPEAYADYLIFTHEYLKKKGKNIPLNASCSGYAVEDYLKAICKSGAHKYINTLNAHFYQSTPESPALYEKVLKHKQLMKKYNAHINFINTEAYYGLVSMYTTTYGEYNRHYFAKTEIDHTGRILQSYLHHIALDIPLYHFNAKSTLYRLGVCNPFFYYFTFGGYRFINQLLIDIKQSESFNINKNIRCFIFEKKNGEKIVTINTKLYETKGSMTAPAGYKNIYDVNGNSINEKVLPVSYLPFYIRFPADMKMKAVKEELKKVDFSGLEFPIEVSFSVNDEKQELELHAKNLKQQPVSFKIGFKSMPEGWGQIKNISMELKGKEEKTLALMKLQVPRLWDKEYKITYNLESADTIITRSFKIPALFIKKADNGITIDGEISDWNQKDLLPMGKSRIFESTRIKTENKGDKDLSAQVGLKWDDENFYVLVIVTDDNSHTGNGALNALYMNDSLQIYFDEKNNGRDTDKTYDTDDVVYSIGMDENGKPVAHLDRAPSGRYVGENNATKGVDKEVEIGYKKTKTGYVYELKFSQTTLPYLNFKENSTFGFSIFIHDNDNGERKPSLVLSSTKVSPYLKPQVWKKVKLINTTVQKD